MRAWRDGATCLTDTQAPVAIRLRFEEAWHDYRSYRGVVLRRRERQDDLEAVMVDGEAYVSCGRPMLYVDRRPDGSPVATVFTETGYRRHPMAFLRVDRFGSMADIAEHVLQSAVPDSTKGIEEVVVLDPSFVDDEADRIALGEVVKRISDWTGQRDKALSMGFFDMFVRMCPDHPDRASTREALDLVMAEWDAVLSERSCLSFGARGAFAAYVRNLAARGLTEERANALPTGE